MVHGKIALWSTTVYRYKIMAVYQCSGKDQEGAQMQLIV